MVLKTENIRALEREIVEKGDTYFNLMKRAGEKVAEVILEKFDSSNFVYTVVCGNGNNGGDGFIVAKQLCDKGKKVTAILCGGEPKPADAVSAFKSFSHSGCQLMFAIGDGMEEIEERIENSDIIVDAVFGIGFKGELRAGTCYKEVLSSINKAHSKGCKVVSVDVPSGTNADTGELCENAVVADVTVTFFSKKPAHVSYPSISNCGKVILEKFGVLDNELISHSKDCNVKMISDMQIPEQIYKREENTNKGSFGNLVVVSGSFGMTGAAVFAVKSALKCGVGLVHLITPKSAYIPVACQVPECVIHPVMENAEGRISATEKNKILDIIEKSKASAVLIGPGLGLDNDIKSLVRSLIENVKSPIILDADGINAVADNINILERATAPMVLTPHPGELSRLIKMSVQDIQKSRIPVAISTAKKLGVTLILKGSRTVVADSNGNAYINETGNSGMAKGGTGDVLAGMIGGLLAKGVCPLEATIFGVMLHGIVGDMAAKIYSKNSVSPLDMINKISALFLKFNEG